MTDHTPARRRVYIAGCGGMLGEAFHDVFGEEYDLRCTDIDVNEPWLDYLDFRDFDAYRRDVLAHGPAFLFHLGALTDLEHCEQHPDDAYATNTLGVENAVLIANELDIPVLYIGTAGIFDGLKETYDDWDEPHPLGVYARSKHAAEVFVREHARRYFICRAGWMMGGGPRKDKKFVHKIMRQLRDGRRELHVVDDKDGTPTYTYDFAQNTRLLVQRGHYGLYNMVCRGMTSRYEVASEILSQLSLHDDVRIHKVTSAFFQEEYFAARPRSERLVNRKLTLRGLDVMRDWRVALASYLRTRYESYVVGDRA